jgi:hypothetical protein
LRWNLSATSCALVVAVATSRTAFAQAGPPVCNTLQTSLSASGAVQQFVVPNLVDVVTIDAAGAQGGGNSIPGGRGARLVASFPVTPGQALNVVVGGAGRVCDLGGGGGGSFVYSTPDASGLLVAAAGGGGGSTVDPGTAGSATTVASGGDGGVAGTGGNGGAPPVGALVGGGGGGGRLLTDGGSPPLPGSGRGGMALANGAGGGTGPCSPPATGGFGGGGGAHILGAGGGGGYNGGGGGASDPGFPAAGGGGGSFVGASGTTLFAQSGAQAGDGQVTFCYAPAAVPSLSAPGIAFLAGALALLGVLLRRGEWKRDSGSPTP